jgi:ABC-type transport system involved in cytochrome c biogenesis permease subunit
MTGYARYVPWSVAVLGALYLLIALAPPADADGRMHLNEFASLLVVDGGRDKPIDTFARVQLMSVTNRQEYRDADGVTQPAVRWLLDTMAEGLANYYKQMNVVHVSDPGTLAWLGLEPRESQRYLLTEFRDKLPEIEKEMARLRQVKPEEWTEADRHRLDLFSQLRAAAERAHEGKAIQAEQRKRKTDEARVFRVENDQVLQMLQLSPREGLRYSYAEIAGSPGFDQFRKKAKAAAARPAKRRDVVDRKALELGQHVETAERVRSLDAVLLVPPSGDEDWASLGKALVRADLSGAPAPLVRSLETIIRCYGKGDVAGFNEAVSVYRQALVKRMPGPMGLAKLEVWFNHFAPFYHCLVLYVVAFVLAAVSWLCWPDVLRRSAFWLAVVILVAHTLALVVRMYLQGRPPVTNLYSSAIFIAWGCVVLCLTVEAIFRNGLSSAVAAALGFASLLIAHGYLDTGGDTLEMMQAVLDTNFWLATHVVCITIGYTATLVAGAFGACYVMQGVLTRALEGGAGKTIAKMVYGILCFATLFSFVGTVLGGIWADQSWGRFWGWDPKENGAVLIVIMNALILHARWGGMVKDRGMAVLSICGVMVTMWSWFGTNQLQVGLHSYGFSSALAGLCFWVWLAMSGLITMGLLPLRYWRSFSAPPRRVPVQGALKPAPQPRPRRGKTGVQTA